MFLIPIGTDQPQKRFPKMTLGIIIACVIMYPTMLWLSGFFGVFNYSTFAEYEALQRQLMVQWLQNMGEDEARARYEKARYDFSAYNKLLSDFKKDLEDGKVIELDSAEYGEWQRLSAEFETARRREPFYRLGYVPSDFKPWSLLTHMFLHGGLGHLFWNMYFLWLIGIGIENIWGRKWFSIMYVAGGLAAVLFHQAITKSPDVPMIGASGAIAAVMGAYMVRFYKARLKYAFFTWEFWLPAWAPLLFWFGGEVRNAIKGLETGVAVGAHIGGYLFGAAFALTLMKMKAEDKFIGEAVKKQDENDARKAQAKLEKQGPARLPEYDEAVRARQYGELEKAAALFRQVLEKQPGNLDARDEVIRIWLQLGRKEELAHDLSGSIAWHFKRGEVEHALSQYNLFMQHAPSAKIAGPWTYRLAQELFKRGAFEHAVYEFQRYASVLPEDPLAAKALFSAAGIEGTRRNNPARALEIVGLIEKRYPGWMPDEVREAREKFTARTAGSPGQ